MENQQSLIVEGGTMERVLAHNAEVLSLAQEHKVNHILIEDKYEISLAI